MLTKHENNKLVFTDIFTAVFVQVSMLTYVIRAQVVSEEEIKFMMEGGSGSYLLVGLLVCSVIYVFGNAILMRWAYGGLAKVF
ncbi:MAG: hypothetical protein COA43_15845 [Robiginitomaculum sp.]|nr:MAG: hypothetical protein COA43_15845 [Robiginitomaculum sp.]